MKVKTSVTLSEELLGAIDRIAEKGCSRSEFIERVAWEVIWRRQREERDRHDVALINRFADELNSEANEFMPLQPHDWENEPGETG